MNLADTKEIQGSHSLATLQDGEVEDTSDMLVQTMTMMEYHSFLCRASSDAQLNTVRQGHNNQLNNKYVLLNPTEKMPISKLKTDQYESLPPDKDQSLKQRKP